MADMPWKEDAADDRVTIGESMNRARALAHDAMQRAETEKSNAISSYESASRKNSRRREEIREENITRHLKHNLDLKAEKHIRIHGGFQWDLFRDNETGRDLPFAA